jgi:hypothetical protein
MADQRISQLVELLNPTGSDLIPIVNAEETKKITVDNLLRGSNFEEITYSDLRDAISDAYLIPGKSYLITDYKTCYDQPNWDANRNAITIGNYKSGSVEPLVVLATSAETLSPYAYSPEYPKDIIKYDVDFTETEVTEDPAFGRIYERVDERGNRADYDWRAVQFKRYDSHYCENISSGKVNVEEGGGSGSIIGVGTDFGNNFSIGDVVGVYNQNNSTIGGFDFYEVINISGSSYMGVTGAYYNTVSNTYYSNANRYSGGSPFQNNLVSVDKNEYEYYTFEDMDDDWYNNYLGDYLDTSTFLLSNNVFRDGEYRDNHFGSNVVGNTFDDDCVGNHCGMNFQYNIINNDWDNNTIGNNFDNNFIACDMQENIIGNDFEYNMIADDEGIDFNFNIINADSFRRNWLTGEENFDSNIISDNFDNNIINNRFGNNLVTGQFNNNYVNGDMYRNQFKGSFTDNKNYNDFALNTFQGFYNNIALEEVLRNQFNGYASDNILSGSFNDNTVGDYFQSNTFRGYTANNEIGTYFENNTIGDSFGYGAGTSRANKIGHYFENNNIGEYFYSNTISDNFNGNTVGDYFQQNTVFANNININDFTALYGNIVSSSIANPNVGGSDGVYPLLETTTNGHGVDATFDVTITSGTASVAIVNVGKLYSTEDSLTITGSLIGGGTNLQIDVDTVSPTPAVYEYLDSTIVRNYQGDLKLTYLGTSGLGIVGINEPVD